MAYNVLQISEGINSVGIWAFAYVLLAVRAFRSNNLKVIIK
jgi:hypothetical protein